MKGRFNTIGTAALGLGLALALALGLRCCNINLHRPRPEQERTFVCLTPKGHYLWFIQGQ